MFSQSAASPAGTGTSKQSSAAEMAAAMQLADHHHHHHHHHPRHQQHHSHSHGSLQQQQTMAAAAYCAQPLSSTALDLEPQQQIFSLQHAVQQQQLPSFFRAIASAAEASDSMSTCSAPLSWKLGPNNHSNHNHNNNASAHHQIDMQQQQQQATTLPFNILQQWSSDETAALIKLRSEMIPSPLSVHHSSVFLWEELSRKLHEIGYQRSPQECKEKLENIQKLYRKGKDAMTSELKEFGEAPALQVSLQHRIHGDDLAALQMNSRSIIMYSGDLAGSKRQRIVDDEEEEEDEGDEYEQSPWLASKRFFQKLTKKMMAKQEGLHRAFLEAMERRERERMAREEEQRRQEAARLMREQEMRAQELAVAAARDSALIAFLEKAAAATTGHTTMGGHCGGETPNSPPIVHHQLLAPLPPASHLAAHGASAAAFHHHHLAHLHGEIVQQQQQQMAGGLVQVVAEQQLVAAAAQAHVGMQQHMAAIGHGQLVDTTATPAATSSTSGHAQMASFLLMDAAAAAAQSAAEMNTRRWPKVEVHALIRLRSGMEPRFREAGPKAHLWQEISASMACLGFIRSPKRCKEKWENINKYFKKTKDSSKKRPENAKTCPYFHQLDTLYERGILASSSSAATAASSSSAAAAAKNALKSVADDYHHKTAAAEMDTGFSICADASEAGADQALEDEEAAEEEEEDTEEDGKLGLVRVAQTGGGSGGGMPQGASFFSSDQQYGMAQTSNGMTLAQQMDKFGLLNHHHQQQQHHHHHDGLMSGGGGGGGASNAAAKKSVQVEMFVKDVLDLQQQQNQKLAEEYERMEQAHELRELERRQQQKSPQHHDAALIYGLGP